MIDQTSGSLRQVAKQRKPRKQISRDTHGDVLKKKKKKNRIRIVFQNINGLMIEDEAIDKRELVREFINKYEIDFYALAEVNVNWSLVPRTDNLYTKCNEWFEHSRISTSHNTLMRTKKRYQPGGVAIIGSGDLSLQVQKCTKDDRLMGRWCSMPLAGKRGSITRIISVYVTSIPTSQHSLGCVKVYAQQQASLLKLKSTQTVEEAFWTDFWIAIDSYLENGEKLIICGDWNEDLYNQEFFKEFKNRNLIPAVITEHTSRAPPTHANGSVPIDEIFVSASLDIQACGFLEQGRNGGDHRPVWIEVFKEDALGTSLPPVATYAARRLKMADQRIVAKYNKILEEQFEKYDIYNRALHLYNSPHEQLSPQQCAEYDLLDQDREKCMKYAEKRCRKLHAGNIPWSPTLQLIRDQKLYIKLTIRRKKGHHVGARYLIRLSKKAGFNFVNLSVDDLGKQLQKATYNYKLAKEKASDNRKSFLTSLAEAKERNGEGKKAKIILQLKKTEEQRKQYRGLLPLRKKFQQNLGTTSVIVTMPDNTTVELTDQQGMIKAIINENRKKFHQSENTCPFLKFPLLHDFGPYGTTKNIEKVLSGTYECPEDTDEFTRLFIDVCKAKEVKTQMERSPSYFKASWKRMKEKTGTHDLHFGHFLASCQHQYNLLVHYIMAEIPFRSGFAPSRWKVATNVMILKKAGMFEIEKLRTLCLFQSDYNHNNKFLGKSMMDHIVKNNYVAKEQYSVSGKKCISQALNKTLIFDIARQSKGTMFLTSCDLKSCYDRIVHTPAMLACQSMGIPSNPLKSFFATLQEVQYHTQTVYGKSDLTFGGKEEGFSCKPQGSGQGNGAAAQLWTVVSTKMFEMLHALGLANIIYAPISGTDQVLVGFAYVDDSDLLAYSIEEDTDDTAAKMQKIIQSWEKAAKVTGGAIAPEKCWWYMVEFRWDENCDWHYVEMEQPHRYNMFVNDHNNLTKQIKYLPPYKANEMLGVHIAPDGNNVEQINQMLTKASKAAEIIRTTPVSPHEAWLGLKTMTMKSLEYCLPATTLSEKDCKVIMKPILHAFLPKAHINRNIKQDVLYADVQSQGLGLHSLYLSQGIKHVIEILEHSWKQSTTGSFLTTSLEYLRLELGINDNILNSDYTKYSFLIISPTWITNTWQFMSKFNITTSFDCETILPKREQDQPIMQLLIDMNIFSNQELIIVNKCRIYLQAFMLSDIVAGNGTQISHNAWYGIKESKSTTIKWPRIARPTSTMWKTWTSVLHKGFCSINRKYLDNPLRKWYEIHSEWAYFIHKENQIIYFRDHNSKYYCHDIITNTRRKIVYSSIRNPSITPHPSTLLPTTVFLHNGHLQTEGTTTFSTDSTPQIHQQIHSHHEWLFPQITRNNDSTLKQSILAGTAIAASDGSYYESYQYATAAWCLTDSNYNVLTEGNSIVPGIGKIHNSYRSELVGFLAILTYIDELQLEDINGTAAIHIIGDNERALEVLDTWTVDKLNPNHKNADILSALLKLRDKIPVTITIQHVHSHQDDTTPVENLPPEVQLNIRMDKSAKEFALKMIHTTKQQYHTTSHYASFPTCYYKDTPILHETFNTLYHLISFDKMQSIETHAIVFPNK